MKTSRLFLQIAALMLMLFGFRTTTTAAQTGFSASNYVSMVSVGRINAVLDGATSATLSAWIYRTNSLGTEQSICSELFVGSFSAIQISVLTNKFRILARPTSASSSLSVLTTNDIPEGEWVHVAGVANFAAGTVKVYVDGREDGVATGALSSPYSHINSTEEPKMGAYSRISTPAPFGGYIESVCVCGQRDCRATKFSN